MGSLYRLSFPNGKSYIGITRGQTSTRFKEHSTVAKLGRGHAVHHAIRKYGLDNVVCETLLIANWEYLTLIEKGAIESYRTKAPYGYNLTNGGEGVVGNVMSEESKRALSELNKGKTIPPETRELISIGMKKVMSASAHRKNISNKLKGKVVSHETRLKLSEAAKKRYSDPTEREKASKIARNKVVSKETCVKLSKSLTAYYAKRQQNEVLNG